MIDFIDISQLPRNPLILLRFWDFGQIDLKKSENNLQVLDSKGIRNLTFGVPSLIMVTVR